MSSSGTRGEDLVLNLSLGQEACLRNVVSRALDLRDSRFADVLSLGLIVSVVSKAGLWWKSALRIRGHGEAGKEKRARK